MDAIVPSSIANFWYSYNIFLGAELRDSPFYSYDVFYGDVHDLRADLTGYVSLTWNVELLTFFMLSMTHKFDLFEMGLGLQSFIESDLQTSCVMAYTDFNVAEIKTQMLTSMKECENSAMQGLFQFAIPQFSKMTCQYQTNTTRQIPELSKQFLGSDWYQ